MDIERPKIGIGVIIFNAEGKILIGKRTGSHAPYYSIPGGHLEMGESFEEAAIKEVFEETGLTIKNPEVFCVTNNLETLKKEGKHYISISLLVKNFKGRPVVKEPGKCEGWLWVDPHDLPRPHFDASEMAIRCYFENKFYIPA